MPLEPLLGEISIVAFDFAPRGWAQCNGQLLPIAQNTALFSLLGTTYGGDGRVTFGLPDLRSRVPVHIGSGPGVGGPSQGEKAGLENVTLTADQLPAHGHARASSLQATSINAAASVPAGQPRRGVARYTAGGTPVVLGGSAVAGENLPHTNLQPSLALNFVIALAGEFPAPN